MTASWDLAIAWALRAAAHYRTRWYVRGYRDPVGRWQYGVYAEPHPPLHLYVSDRGKLIVPPTLTPAKSVH